ncbi:translation initiation factor 2 [uncultured Rummeliibacillus sp.]|uniref:translation initiation factor 2 n=1 Tax=uncultured Rummeliibacillus sp. TaxID=762292 RepID=UPI00260190D1|nr:translation initiation factor 2 [uncultured Rummeliibacillus sp.]
MANKNNYPNEFNNESPDILAAWLAFIGSLLATIGDGLTTVASNIALQQLLQNENNNSQGNQNSNNQISNNQVDQSKQIESLQRQVDYLTRKIDKRK